MPEITAITPQKNDPSRFNIAVDGEFVFALSSTALLKSGLYRGQKLETEELAQIKNMAHDNRAYDQALNYLSRRKRSRLEIKHYLERKQVYESEIIDAAIERLEQAGLISDEEFAKSWLADRRALKPSSRRRLAQELNQKGIGKLAIEEALGEIGDDEELEQIRQLINKKSASYPDRQKLIRYLAAQGYSFDLIKRAITDGN